MRQPIDPARTVENTGKRVDECITLHFDDHLLGHVELGVQVHHQRHRSYTQTQLLRAYSQLRNHRFVGKPADITYAITARLGTTRPDISEEHTSELQSLMRISYAVYCLKTKTKT